VVDVLNRMLEKAAEGGLIKGLLTNFTPNGVISLQYADDTILFSDCEESHLRNLKSCLCLFEHISGMRINFHKSEIVPMNLNPSEAHEISHIFGCPIGSFPLKYLGVPLHFDKIKREELQPLVDKILKKIGSWRGRLLSSAARIMLIKTCLASIPVYLLSFIKFPKWALQLLNTHMANCLWDDSVDRHRYHLVNWETVSMCKKFGGLGIPNLRELNMCLLGSWLKRYQEGGEKTWKLLLDFKYNTSDPNILCSSSRGASNFFKGIMWAAKAAKLGYMWKIGNGQKVKFWEDNWLGSSSLAIQFWKLYEIVNEKSHTVCELWDGTTLRCSFRRTVSDQLMNDWNEVVQLASTISFSFEEDTMIWRFSSNGIYSSQSLYKIINFRGVMPVHISAVWSLKIPPRVHFFLWLLAKNKLLTRDNLNIRQKLDDVRCLFCSEDESIHHLFFDCVVSRQI